MGISVEKALTIGGLAQGILLAGKRNLNKTIEYVDIMESPYESNWPAKNYLYITAFYALINDIQGQTRSIELLSENGCSALCFQSFHIPELDSHVIQRAEELGLPLIQVPASVHYPQIITPLVEAIFTESNQISISTLDANKKLMSVYVPGSGFQKVIAALRQFIDHPIEIIDTHGCKLSERYYTHSALILRDFEKTISDHMGSRPTSSWIETYNRWLLPVYSESKKAADAYITIFDPECQLVNSDIILAEQAANIIAFELAIKKKIWETENRLKKGFIEDLFSGNFLSKDEMLERARALGLDLLNKRVVVVIDLHYFNQQYSQFQDQELQTVLEIICQCEPSDNFFELPNQIVIFPNFKDGAPLSTIRNDIENLARSIRNQIFRCYKIEAVPIAVGGLYKGIEGLCQSYDEAQLALKLSKDIGKFKDIIWYDDIAIFPILDKFLNQPAVHQWLEKTLGPLSEYDQNNGTELIKTLEIYFDTNQKIKDSAHLLAIHPKTLKYRLQRIKDIVGKDIFLGEKQFNYYLATKLARIFTPITKNRNT